MNEQQLMARVTNELRAAGCIAAEDEATELLRAAGDTYALNQMLERRVAGEPLAWITGTTSFCGIELLIEPGVYVPRWQSESLAATAAELLPDDGLAVDLATGSGAVAVVMQTHRRTADVYATECDPVAVHCARRNGVHVFEGDLDDPLPQGLASRVDVLTAILPYVPTESMSYLPQDVQRFEPRTALDGGADGLDLISKAIHNSHRWLKPGGWLLVEAGVDQIESVTSLLQASDYQAARTLYDGDDEARGICARRNRGS